jgi:hypothetical protein
MYFQRYIPEGEVKERDFFIRNDQSRPQTTYIKKNIVNYWVLDIILLCLGFIGSSWLQGVKVYTGVSTTANVRTRGSINAPPRRYLVQEYCATVFQLNLIFFILN